jgi:hypothetical protein
MNIDAENKIAITVGENIQLTLNGSSGTVTLKCTSLKIDANSSVKMETTGKMGIRGGNISLEASSVLKASSSGLTSIGGSPIKVG